MHLSKQGFATAPLLGVGQGIAQEAHKLNHVWPPRVGLVQL